MFVLLSAIPDVSLIMGKTGVTVGAFEKSETMGVSKTTGLQDSIVKMARLMNTNRVKFMKLGI
jgi:hypothetical protein